MTPTPLLQALLRSDIFLDSLLESRTKDFSKSVEPMVMDFLRLSYDMRKDDQEIELESLIAQLKNESKIRNQPITKYNVTLILCEYLGKRYLYWTGEFYQVRDDQVHNWHDFCQILDPSWILGALYARSLREGLLSEAQLLNALEKQCPFGFTIDRSQKQIADNHVHLGGNGNPIWTILEMCLEFSPPKNRNEIPFVNEHQVFNTEKRKLTDLPSFIFRCFHTLFEYSPNSTEEGQKNTITLPPWLEIFATSKQISPLRDPSASLAPYKNQKFLWSYIDQKQTLSTEKRWILLCTLLHQKYSQSSNQCTHLSQVFSAFIHATNLLRGQFVMNGVGLSHFVDFFGFAHRKSRNFEKQASIHDLGPSTSREFKVSPYLLSAKEIINRRSPLYQYLSKPDLLEKSRRIQFGIHFVRSINRSKRNNSLAKSVNKIAQREFTQKRKEIIQETRRIIKELTSPHSQQIPCGVFPNAQALKLSLPALFRAIDVAGNENDYPIEVFAPAIRVLRSQEAFSLANANLLKPFRNFHLSIHAGEDFSHLLQGIRAVDETVEFCDFRSKDRIGHGLSLGYSPQIWAERQKISHLRVGQHLDNLVWAYHTALEMNTHHNFDQILRIYEKKIELWAEFVYNESVSPSTLWEAMKLRKNCPIHYFRNAPSAEGDSLWCPIKVEPNPKCSMEPSKLSEKNWEKYLNFGRFESHELKDLSNENPYQSSLKIHLTQTSTKLPSPRTNPFEDFTHPQELDLWEALQDHLLEKLSQKDIILEACPSSNLRIGLLKEMHEHPIFRWNPPNSQFLLSGEKFNRFGIRKGSNQVCVNTDDSALMITNLFQEYESLRKSALEKHSIGNLDAKRWIEEIQSFGVDVFQENHEEWLRHH